MAASSYVGHNGKLLPLAKVTSRPAVKFAERSVSFLNKQTSVLIVRRRRGIKKVSPGCHQ